MKKAIFVIASTAIALYTIKIEKRSIIKQSILSIHIIKEKIKDKVPYLNEDILSFIFIFPLKDFLLLIPNVLSGIFTHILKGHIYKWIHNNYTFKRYWQTKPESIRNRSAACPFVTEKI